MKNKYEQQNEAARLLLEVANLCSSLELDIRFATLYGTDDRVIICLDPRFKIVDSGDGQTVIFDNQIP